jgi:DNA-binding LacI/PurR family transcriptional regulator
VAVVDYDNNDVSLGVIPSLTIVDNKFEELVKCLATELLRLIDGPVKSFRKIISPVLVERASHARGKGGSWN